ncbi:MAG: hypothetical protein CL940_12395 [Deltaproteobacteria bacterium]|nr:hypothetical protein [Deltaproteobacteria bacterium]
MPVPAELLQAAAEAAAEVQADLARAEEASEEEDSMGATMGMQAVPAELLNLAIDPETGEFTGGESAPVAEEAAAEVEASESVLDGTERTMFEQPAITLPPEAPEPEPEPDPVAEAAVEPEAPARTAADAIHTEKIETGTDQESPVTRSQLRTIVLAAVGLGVLAMLVPLIMSLSSGGGPAGGKPLAIHNFPSHTNAIGNLSLSRLRSTWVYNEVGEKALTLALDEAGAAKFKKDFGVDLSQVDVIAAGLQVGGAKEPETLLALQGRFDTESVETALKGSLGDLEAGAPGSVAEGAFFGKLNGAAGMVDDNTILHGSVGMLAAAVAARGGTASVGTHAGLMAALKEVDADALLWGGVQITKELLSAARKELPSDLAGMLASGDAAAFSVEVEDSAVIRVAYFAVDESRATELANTLKGRMGQAKLLAATAGAPFGELLNAVETSQAGPVVSVKASISRAVGEELLKSLNASE